MVEGGDGVGAAPPFSWQKSENTEMYSRNSPGRLVTEKQWDLVGNSYAFGKREFPQLEDIKH